MAFPSSINGPSRSPGYWTIAQQNGHLTDRSRRSFLNGSQRTALRNEQPLSRHFQLVRLNVHGVESCKTSSTNCNTGSPPWQQKRKKDEADHDQSTSLSRQNLTYYDDPAVCKKHANCEKGCRCTTNRQRLSVTLSCCSYCESGTRHLFEMSLY